MLTTNKRCISRHSYPASVARHQNIQAGALQQRSAGVIHPYCPVNKRSDIRTHARVQPQAIGHDGYGADDG